MEHAVDKGSDTLLQYGIGGVFLLFLIGVGWLLWSALQKAQDENRALTREAIAGLNASTAATKDLADGLRATDERNESRLQALKGMADQLGALSDIGKRNAILLEQALDGRPGLAPARGGRS